MQESNGTSDEKKTKALLACGAIAPPLFIIVFLIEGVVRPGYNSLRHPISSLSIGEQGWMQITNFIFTGMLLLAFAFGLRRLFQLPGKKFHGPLLIGLVAIGLIGAGIFSTDPLFGYPEDKPLALAQYSVHGHLHDFFSLFVFICLPLACFSFRKKLLADDKYGWANYSVFTAIKMLVTFVLAGIGFKQLAGFEDIAGVLQRLSICIGWIWMMLLAIYYMKNANLVAHRLNREKLGI
jgi:hypothetical membrane protein